MIDYVAAADNIAEVIAAVDTPLTEGQRILLAGAVAVWLDHAKAEGRAVIVARLSAGHPAKPPQQEKKHA